MKKQWKRIILSLLIIAGIWNFGITAEAAGETTKFGSESYEWALNETVPIGVYANSDQPITAGEMQVVYDAEMLEFVSGGELVEPGVVNVFGGDGITNEFSAMLQFVPRIAGNTNITIRNSNISNIAGEVVSVPETSVGVNVLIPESCGVSNIQVNGATVAGFAPNITTYNLEVDNSVTDAGVVVQPVDANTQVEVTETALNVGANRIQIQVTDINGNRARYVLNVTRKETEVIKETETEPSVEKQEDAERQEKADELAAIQQKNESAARKNNIITALAIILLIAMLGFLIWIKFHLEQKKKRRRKNKKVRKVSTHQEVYRKKQGLSETITEEDDLEKAEYLDELEEFDLTDDNRENEIVVDHVTMEFTREKDEATSVKELLVRTLKGQRHVEKFKALDDVSFTVKKGDVLGIIGTNGSGKSTILKIISDVLEPTKGRVEVDKNKIQLLTLGTGFDFELTGRENVYLNGAVIGYTREYIDEKYDEIVKFAELEGFMEEKVRNYSSGMVSRLGFAIATVRDTPEILILDEVLSVGDMFFRKKSEARIKEMIKSGSTVLIVSHSPSVIRANCTKAVWIEKGVLKAIGKPEDVCRAYEKMNG